ncbi:hypothetical protein FXN65_24415 [Metapseudomonas lalkuanensis]|uniref:Uncharacterized protein n=1 Tax=Metapseudomonas lalkuanensis TaxID=2604832 RepID=A0A5J6QRN1_9GAMM|nr:hypothetical protein [Pseudomonas lalkuanensis]QEY65047.1 hypothetical protein FXN65_24415 [Pseudomonas lalkuanensis]UCO97565.1 hypothetical protein LF844_23375 [Pseudomonas lalkuanensis]
MASDSTQASPRTRGENLVTCGWIALATAIPVSCIFSSEPFDFSAGLAALSLISLCAAFACWPKLFITPINYRKLCDEVPRSSSIAMAVFVALTVLRGFVELVA